MTKRVASQAFYTRTADAAGAIAVRADDFALHELLTLRALIDHELIPAAVDARRAKGQTWEQIGADLGLTRQGAQQRFGGRPAE
ncbi:MAG: hypothetical protein ABWZ02_07750 [Nakamurella sp.]